MCLIFVCCCVALCAQYLCVTVLLYVLDICELLCCSMCSIFVCCCVALCAWYLCVAVMLYVLNTCVVIFVCCRVALYAQYLCVAWSARYLCCSMCSIIVLLNVLDVCVLFNMLNSFNYVLLNVLITLHVALLFYVPIICHCKFGEKLGAVMLLDQVKRRLSSLHTSHKLLWIKVTISWSRMPVHQLGQALHQVTFWAAQYSPN